MFSTREVSLLRKLVPFTFHASGPVREVIRGGFERHPHCFGMALEALEELDTSPQPRMALAEAFQGLMLGDRVPIAALREAFGQAEELARAEMNGELDHERAVTDPVYKLTVAQLNMAAGYWARMLNISHAPWVEADVFVHHRYSTDIRDCEVITPYTVMLTSEEGRAAVDERIEGLLKDVLLLERDLYGQWRLDRRSERTFIMHKVRGSDIDKSWETFGIMDIPVVREHGNFSVDVKNRDRDGRWKVLTVKCRPETEPVAWEDWLDVPALRHPTAAEILKDAAAQVSSRERDALLEGRVQLLMDTPILPRRNAAREEDSFTLELPVVKEDPSLFARLLRERSDVR